MSRPTLVIFGPLPPARNGLADYVDGLLPHLADRYRCVVVLADDAPDPDPVPAEIVFETEYRASRSLGRERHLYQFGNNAGLGYVIPELDRTPGLLTVHDLSFASLASHLMPRGVYSPKFRELARLSDGERGESIARLAAMDGRYSSTRANEMSLLPLLTERAMGVVAHSKLAESRLRALGGAAPVILIPCFAPVPRKARSGVGPLGRRRPPSDRVELLCAGFAGRTKRIDLVLRAVKLLVEQGHPVRLTIAGELRPEEYDLMADIKRLGVGDSCRVLDYLSEEELSRMIAETDLLVNLRLPTTGESSGPMLRALWLGACVAVTDLGSFSELPDEAVIKVSRSEMTGDGLAGRLLPYIRDAELRRNVGRQAEAYAKALLAPQRAAELYEHTIERLWAAPRTTVAHNGKGWFRLLPAIEGPRIRRHVADRKLDAGPGPARYWSDLKLPVGSGAERLLIVGGAASDRRIAEAFGWTEIVQAAPNESKVMAAGEDFSAALLLALPAEQAQLRRLLSAVASRLKPFAPALVNVPKPDFACLLADPEQLEAALASVGLEPVREGPPLPGNPPASPQCDTVEPEICRIAVLLPGWPATARAAAGARV